MANKAYLLQELDEVLESLSKKDIQAIFAFLGQTTFRSSGERWKNQEGQRAEALKEQITTNQQRLLSNVKEMGVFDEKLPDPGTKLDFSMVHGATMSVVKSRLDFMIEHREFLKTSAEGGLGIFMAAGDRKLMGSGKPLGLDDNVLNQEGGFVKGVCERFGDDATEAQAVQHLLEKEYGLKDGMINVEIDGKNYSVPCEVVQGPKELSENQHRTDTFGATRQVVKNIIAKNPDYFKVKRNIASVSNNINIERQGFTVKRALKVEFSGKLPEDLHMISIGAGKECEKVDLRMLSDIVGATSWEKLLDACPELKQVQDAILMQKRDLGVAKTQGGNLNTMTQTSNEHQKRGGSTSDRKNTNSQKERTAKPKGSNLKKTS